MPGTHKNRHIQYCLSLYVFDIIPSADRSDFDSLYTSMSAPKGRTVCGLAAPPRGESYRI